MTEGTRRERKWTQPAPLGARVTSEAARPRGLALVLARATILALVASDAAAAWRRPGFGPTNQSFNPHEATLTSANVGTLVERWSVPGLGAIDGPVAGGGRVFVVDRDVVRALDAADGTELWEVEYTAGIPDPTLCCGLSRPTLLGDGRLLAFPAEGCGASTCPALWSVDPGDAPITAGPIVTDGMLYAGTGDGTLFAYGLPDD